VSSEPTWLENAAGPLLLLPDSLLSEWSGIDVPDFRVVEARFRWSDREKRACDYDRACDVDDYAGVIPVGCGEGLVLGDEPARTTWLARPFGGLFARWEYAESGEDMNRALGHIPDSLGWADKGTFVVVSSPLQLFNSAEPGLEVVMSRLRLNLASGAYSVRWTRYAPDNFTAVSLVELRRASI
jgi:Immunity protein 21